MPNSNEEEALGLNPTDRGQGGSKISLHADDQNGKPLGVTCARTKVHDSRMMSSIMAANVPITV
ncbi:MAG TPA: hypothetical protein DEP36_12945 [Gammaproteobacteria bacterium]|nr:hypothetical protein [Gammaproteobacteria bacterium]